MKGAGLKRIVFVAALAAMVSGCSRTAQVDLMTDGRGNLASARIVESSGDPSLDKQAIVHARRNFPKAVPHPGSNQRYIQPVAFKEKPCDCPA